MSICVFNFFYTKCQNYKFNNARAEVSHSCPQEIKIQAYSTLHIEIKKSFKIIPWLLDPYPTAAGELAGIVPGATGATNGELAAPLTVEVLTGNKGWET